jgi:hypothetical protein
MSQPNPMPVDAASRGARQPRSRESATTAEGIAGERVLLATRRGAHRVPRAIEAARRLDSAARGHGRTG